MNPSKENIAINPQKIDEFKLLYEKSFNKEISFEEASDMSRHLINLFKVVLQENNPLDKVKINTKLGVLKN